MFLGAVTQPSDIAIIGGGNVGLATALALTDRYLAARIVNKEATIAAHRTGHNSRVIHSGICAGASWQAARPVTEPVGPQPTPRN